MAPDFQIERPEPVDLFGTRLRLQALDEDFRALAGQDGKLRSKDRCGKAVGSSTLDQGPKQVRPFLIRFFRPQQLRGKEQRGVVEARIQLMSPSRADRRTLSVPGEVINSGGQQPVPCRVRFLVMKDAKLFLHLRRNWHKITSRHHGKTHKLPPFVHRHIGKIHDFLQE